MAITQAICNSFKTQLLCGQHNFTAAGVVTATVVGAGTGVYTVTLVGGINNGLAGQRVVCATFGTAANNGTYLITASNATTITTTNAASANSGVMGTCTLGDTFKLALYTSTRATLDKSTTNYDSTNEVGNSGTYTAGGGTLVNTTPSLATDTAVCDFSDISFTGATITARAALIYNTRVIGAAGGAAVLVLNFTSDYVATGGTFLVTFPTMDASNAILRIA